MGGHEIDAIVIGVIILVNAISGFAPEHQAEEALPALKQRAAPSLAKASRP